ncbi:DUF305 domain-containing protein [Phytohabitans aurantiacus]|jgi:uncharacterized protein (DUF305 family)|uniref:DUF305 domain-containing protein n=1 Tax=Phytohabitans aurantiacus TaxID=3016789 RepID=A0ABQ5QVD3_9ACTN|nr:DUF305 domain-containing protein [Phytohabitans aurantiacus]GLH98528.1 hypothetical protein Pa4123_38030 [Phytohabitans aurantiacus]
MTRVITLRRLLLTSAASLATIALAAGCGGDGDDPGGMNHGGASSPTAAATSNGTFNDADVQFAQMMIPHHQQAVEMATLAETRAADPEVKQLATQVKAAQDPEIKTMTGWLTAWGQSTAAPDGGHDMPGMSSMPGMMLDDDMAKLEAAKGTEFDRMFAQMMIAHHDGAIQMAKDEQKNGANIEAKSLAATIEKTQTDEVAKLQGVVDRL